MVANIFPHCCFQKQNYFTCIFLSQPVSFQITSFQTQKFCRTRCCSNQSKETNKKKISKPWVENPSQTTVTSYIDLAINKMEGWGGCKSDLRSLSPSLTRSTDKGWTCRYESAGHMSKDFMRSCYCYHYIPWHLRQNILMYLTQRFCTTVLFQL